MNELLEALNRVSLSRTHRLLATPTESRTDALGTGLRRSKELPTDEDGEEDEEGSAPDWRKGKDEPNKHKGDDQPPRRLTKVKN